MNSSRLTIPEIGDRVITSEPWSFSLYKESRNTIYFTLRDVGVITEFQPDDLYAVMRKFQFDPDLVDRTVWFLFADAPTFKRLIAEFNQKIEQQTAADDDDDDDIDELRQMLLLIEQYQYGTDFTLDAGTMLSIDRVYIRRGLSDFSSLTFNIIDTTTKHLADKKKFAGGRRRFWAKLEDVNRMRISKWIDKFGVDKLG